MQLLFWLFSILIIYTYAGYPVLMWIIGFIRPRVVIKNAIEPTVVILTSAYNEKDHIEATIRNKFTQDYPQENLHYVVISDGSDDGTDEIVKNLQGEYPNLHFIRQEERAGKTAALNKAVEFIMQQGVGCRVSGVDENENANLNPKPQTHDPILLFSDANSIYKPGAIKALVRNFADPEVGYVTGQMVYQTITDNGISEGCGAYMTYENRLRELETKAGSVIGVDGGIDACRLDLYAPMQPEDLPDLVLPLSIMRKGYRVVYEPEAVIVEDANDTHDQEFSMRVRVSLRSMHALWKFKDLTFNIPKYGLTAVQILSHKGFRYDVGWMQAIVLITNYLLIPVSTFYHVVFTLQLIFYGFAVYGYIRSVVSVRERSDRRNLLTEIAASASRLPRNDDQEKSDRRNTQYAIRHMLSAITRLSYYLCLVNAASCIAGIQWLRGKRQVIWSPRT